MIVTGCSHLFNVRSGTTPEAGSSKDLGSLIPVAKDATTLEASRKCLTQLKTRRRLFIFAVGRSSSSAVHRS